MQSGVLTFNSFIGRLKYAVRLPRGWLNCNFQTNKALMQHPLNFQILVAQTLF